MKRPPDEFIYPLHEFGDLCRKRVSRGEAALYESKVAIVGLARNCGEALQANLARALELCEHAADFAIHIEENDSTDSTKQVLIDACKAHSNVTATMQTLGRKQRDREFAGPRTMALAEYRTACQDWVRDCASDADFVIVIDWDQKAGWTPFGVPNGIGCLLERPDASAMASVSLVESQIVEQTKDGFKKREAWVHYDAWALRLNSWIDDYTLGRGAWKHQWVPFVGTDPVPVRSAFGGLCIYRTADYLTGTYTGEDCEHVTFHRTMAERTGRTVYINPTQRCVMQWLDN